MTHVTDQPNPHASKPTGPAHPVAASALAGAMAALLALVIVSQPQPMVLSEPPELPTAVVSATPPNPSRDVLRAAFFDAEVEPRIVETDARNRQAAERCVERLRIVIEGYRRGVDPFVEDLTSISTRFGIARRMPAGWWKGDGRVQNYVQEKFEKHLFSEAELMRDIAGVLNDFRSEIDANQKRMLVSVQASLSTADLPEVDIAEYEPFFESVARQLRDYSAQQGTTSVYNALTVLVVSEAGSYAAITAIAGLLARFGSTVAVSAVAAGGATVGATATGAGGGSLAGPIGTVVGLGVGLAVGLAIDWWMTEQFEEKMNAQMKHYLDSLEETLVHGTSADGSYTASTPASISSQGGIAGRCRSSVTDCWMPIENVFLNRS